jgi:hypothetical protein
VRELDAARSIRPEKSPAPCGRPGKAGHSKQGLAALFAAEGAAVLIGITAAGILGDLVGIIPVLITQDLGFIVGCAVVLTRRRLFAAPGTPDCAQVDPTPA